MKTRRAWLFVGSLVALSTPLLIESRLANASNPPQLPVDEAFQKITRAPKEDSSGQPNDGIIVDDHGNIVEAPSFPKPEVQILPAPDLKALEAPPKEAPKKEASAEPTPKLSSTPKATPEATSASTPPPVAASPTATPVVTAAPSPSPTETPAATPAAIPAATPAPEVKRGQHGPASVSAPVADLSVNKINGVPAEKSLRWLTNGNARFVKHALRADGRAAGDRLRLINGDHPHAIVLSCSDSRAPAEIVFDQALGEIVSVRVSGEVPDSSALAAIEDAVERLGVKLIVVMGHSRCDAVESALRPDREAQGLSEAGKKTRDSIQAHLKSANREKPSTNDEVESALNADVIARDLTRQSEIIRRHVDAGDLVIKSALYNLDTGVVRFY